MIKLDQKTIEEQKRRERKKKSTSNKNKHGKIDMLIGKVLLEEIMQAPLELVVKNPDKDELQVLRRAREA